MQRFILTILCPVLFIFVSCENHRAPVVDYAEIQTFLHVSADQAIEDSRSEFAFWESKLNDHPGQFPYLAKMASARTELFELTGNINDLKYAERCLETLNRQTDFSNAGNLRSLARNYITQHKFREAYALLKRAEENGEGLAGTQKMLFDVHFELGNYHEAANYLAAIENRNDFDYLIRASRWEDHEGNLDGAIRLMEQALAKAGDLKDQHRVQWSLTNLADFYGHAGRIQDSYEHYLKALAYDGKDAYAKKKIAWIAYAHDLNVEAAEAIMQAVNLEHETPDDVVFKSELAAYARDDHRSQDFLEDYFATVSNPAYGVMYNQYSIELLADEQRTAKEALELATREVAERPTPVSYALLANAHLANGNNGEALEVVEAHVEGKTFEPVALVYMALIYSANGRFEKVNDLKEEIVASSFELGPMMIETFNQF